MAAKVGKYRGLCESGPRVVKPVTVCADSQSPRYFHYTEPKAATRLSKFLSQHLRHQPQAIGLTLQEGGWVEVADLLAAHAAHGHPLTRDQLEGIVEDNDKQRFAFNEAGQRIRAQQGHSVDADLQLTPAEPPAVLYHGTVPVAIPAVGGVFYKSGNGVWLIDSVPPQYLRMLPG